MRPRAMKESLEVLNLILEELDIPTSIRTVSERLLIQKSIFLAQTVGQVPLGYSYGWYVRGPYAPSLTRDYYALQAELAALDPASNERRQTRSLRGDVRGRLNVVAKLLTPPSDISLTKPAWAELIASVVYLTRVEHRSESSVEERIRETKPWLADCTARAIEVASVCL